MVQGSELQAQGNPHKRDPHWLGPRMLAPRLRGIHMGHEFLGSRIEGLVLESFLHECGEPHKWVRHSGTTRWLRPSRDGTTAKEEVVAAALRSSRRSPRSPSLSFSSSSPAPTSSSTAARWSLSAGRASGCAAPRNCPEDSVALWFS